MLWCVASVADFHNTFAVAYRDRQKPATVKARIAIRLVAK